MTVCSVAGCGVRVSAGSKTRGRCPEHARAHERQYRQHYDASTLYGRRWQRARRVFLAENPLCEDCTKVGRVTPATEVHHRIRHRGDAAIFWRVESWAAVCKPCHAKHTARESGWSR